MLKSENFNITLWNWDMLCMWDTYTNWKFENWLYIEYPKIINWEDFLIQVANFALQLAESQLLQNIINPN